MSSFQVSAFMIVLLGAASMQQQVHAAEPVDPCRAAIPGSLLASLTTGFPDFRAPLLTDNETDDISYNQGHGGTGCLGVAAADFTGKGKRDFVVGLTPLNGRNAIVVVALPNRDAWTLVPIASSDDRSRLYVSTVPPGRYDAAISVEDSTERGALETMTCPHHGVITGATESTGVV